VDDRQLDLFASSPALEHARPIPAREVSRLAEPPQPATPKAVTPSPPRPRGKPKTPKPKIRHDHVVDVADIPPFSPEAVAFAEEALANEVDVTLFVKDVTRPSLVQQEVELLRTMQRSDRSILLHDRLFVVLTKVDLFDRPDENGNWHWSLAVRNFKDHAIDRVFPYSKLWAHAGVNPAHPVARQVQDFYNQTQPVSGLEQVQGAIAHYLANDVERLDAAGPGEPSRKRIRHQNSHRQVLDETSWAGGMRPSVNTCSETKSREPSKKIRTRTHQRTLTITPS
jgi:hypothetical protein